MTTNIRMARRTPLRDSRRFLFSKASLIVTSLLGAIFLAAFVGCGKANPYLPVTGVVKFDDGTVPKGDISSITFQPTSGGLDSKGAQGTIEADGSFQLHSERPGDGAKPGSYAVTVHIMVGYPKGKSVVPLRYTDPRKTPFSAEVTADGENQFSFTIEKP
ncbi:MAG: hypothetical protein ABGX16_13395 [Pirellulales bacterium]